MHRRQLRHRPIRPLHERTRMEQGRNDLRRPGHGQGTHEPHGIRRRRPLYAARRPGTSHSRIRKAASLLITKKQLVKKEIPLSHKLLLGSIINVGVRQTFIRLPYPSFHKKRWT